MSLWYQCVNHYKCGCNNLLRTHLNDRLVHLKHLNAVVTPEIFQRVSSMCDVINIAHTWVGLGIHKICTEEGVAYCDGVASDITLGGGLGWMSIIGSYLTR